MKITNITTYVVTDNTLAGQRRGGLAWQWVFVKMETDAGVHGWVKPAPPPARPGSPWALPSSR